MPRRLDRSRGLIWELQILLKRERRSSGQCRTQRRATAIPARHLLFRRRLQHCRRAVSDCERKRCQTGCRSEHDLGAFLRIEFEVVTWTFKLLPSPTPRRDSRRECKPANRRQCRRPNAMETLRGWRAADAPHAAGLLECHADPHLCSPSSAADMQGIGRDNQREMIRYADHGWHIQCCARDLRAPSFKCGFLSLLRPHRKHDCYRRLALVPP